MKDNALFNTSTQFVEAQNKIPFMPKGQEFENDTNPFHGRPDAKAKHK